MSHEVHKEDLIAAASKEAGVTYAVAEASINAFLNQFVDAVAEHKEVQIRGFGTISATVKPPRQITLSPLSGRAGEKVQSKPNVFIRFTPSPRFKALVLEKNPACASSTSTSTNSAKSETSPTTPSSPTGASSPV